MQRLKSWFSFTGRVRSKRAGLLCLNMVADWFDNIWYRQYKLGSMCLHCELFNHGQYEHFIIVYNSVKISTVNNINTSWTFIINMMQYALIIYSVFILIQCAVLNCFFNCIAIYCAKLFYHHIVPARLMHCFSCHI